MRTVLPLWLSVFALTACGSREADPRGVDRREVLVQVVASGRSETRPDEARFTAGVETIAATAADASRRNGEVMARVAAALQGMGVRENDLQTQAVTLSRIGYGPQRGQFQASNVVEVRLRDVTQAGQAIAATTAAGANVLSGPNLRVADPEAASRTAYAAAYRAARARADTYAEAAGLKVSRVLSIRDMPGAGSPMPYPIAAQTVAPPPLVRTEQASGPPVQAGLNTSEVRVQVDFALSE